VSPEINTHCYNEYMESHEDDDVSLSRNNRRTPRLHSDVELMEEEELGPLKIHVTSCMCLVSPGAEVVRRSRLLRELISLNSST
jgi:hypothetical protein